MWWTDLDPLSLLTTVLTSELQEFLPYPQHTILQVMVVILNKLEIVNFVDFGEKKKKHGIILHCNMNLLQIKLTVARKNHDTEI